MILENIIWLSLVMVIIGEFVVPYLLAVFYPSYSHTKMVMSILGSRTSPVRRYYNIWLIVAGIVICMSGVVLHDRFAAVSENLALALSVILIIYGVGACILAGLFSVNATRSIETIPDKVHGIGAGIGFMALLFLPLIASSICFAVGRVFTGILSILLFASGITFFVLFIMSEKKRFANTVVGYSGLWQRLVLISLYASLLMLIGMKPNPL